VTGSPIAGSAAVGAPAPPGPKLTVRPTTPADLPAVVSLLAERDAHQLDPAHVSSALCGLEPAHLAGWIAYADDKPAGLTTLYTRDQRWGDRTIRAGYWSHLFVREEFRRLMVYPQLVLAMMRGIKPLGIDCIFTGTRRPHVAEGHVKLGFAKLGEYRVMYKPLRPFRLLARYKNLPFQAATAPADSLYRLLLGSRTRPPAGISIRAVQPNDHAIEGIARLLNAAGNGRVRQVWTADSLHRRLARTIDGYDYRLLVAERTGELAGVSVYRLTIRERVRAGVIMELAAQPADPGVIAALVSETERRLRAEGADTTLCLNGLEPATNALLARRGHRTSKETYQMLVWPKTLVPASSAAADLANWRFSFLDHDAF
jgi:hypothetical protein